MKNFLRSLALTLGLAGLPGLALADAVQTFQLASANNIQSLTPTACVTYGNNGVGDPDGIRGLDVITTGGVSSATVTAVNNLNPFPTPMAAGDIIDIPVGSVGEGGDIVGVILTVNTQNSITLTAPITVASTGLGFNWYHQVCGTTATSGWIDVGFYYEKDLTFQGDTVGAATGIDVQWQCRQRGLFSQPVQVFPACAVGACGTVQNYATAGQGIGNRTNVVIYEPWAQCRALFNVHSGAPGTNSITITLTGRVRKP